MALEFSVAKDEVMRIDDLGISTSWNASGVLGGKRIIEEMMALGFRRVEVDYRVREEAVDGIEEAVRNGAISVTSIHNFSPLGRDEKPSSCGGDKLSLASLDEGERREAVGLTLKSIELAHRLGARALVLHTGEVEGIGRSYFRELAEIVKAKGVKAEAARRLRDAIIEARMRTKAGYLEAVVGSLKDLLPSAIDAKVKLCIENRYFYHQIPIFEDVLFLLKAVDSDFVGYWHDIGHGHVLEVLGFVQHLEWFEMLRPYVIGLHIHDAIFTDDHLAPGKGEIDLGGILAKAPDSAIKVLELSSKVTSEEIRQGLAFLSGL